ncbi:hypothetical protein DF121_12710 [Burkholderia stagnalis]|nr:hypothetical protein DF145_11760 [Burkholderia stagnalis]RQY01956.1 hypothetical protein DF121_12710 [Burkholderia stagnalis]RQY17794.1 hypothetical protein DF115_14870 [Burkholderia stagnalis]RQY33634.1 hypothetical protein DF114_08045 [Burkholderia stagnalis]
MVRGTEHSSSSACLELAMRGREGCIGIHRAFGIDRNFGIPQQERADAAVFRVRDMRTIVSLEQGISCPSDVAIACQIEICVVVGESTRRRPVSRTHPHISAYGVAVNFVTPISEGMPGAYGCAPMIRRTICGTLVPASDFECENNLLWLDLNNRPSFEATLEEMTWPISEIVCRIARQFPMRQGDLVFTGPTQPALSVRPNDVLRGGVEGLSRFCLHIGRAARGPNVQIASAAATDVATRSGRAR